MNEQNPFVCVIDDESSMRESLSNLLRSAGLKVQVFASAQEFLADWPQEPPAVWYSIYDCRGSAVSICNTNWPVVMLRSQLFS
jgi:FixJ family two-component response regulator